MSVLDQIRELDKQKNQLLAGAKQEAMNAANAAIATLSELGFHYKLVQSDGSAPTRAQRTSTGTRRSGIRDDVLGIVTDAGPGGVTSAKIAEALGMTDKAGKQAIANALAALSKDKVKQAVRGQPYTAV